LSLEVGLVSGWVRFWRKGDLLPLPADLVRDLEDAKRVAVEEKRRADDLQKRLEEAKRELARYRAGPPAAEPTQRA